ncbi:MAG TPA: GNAT family N-acetyltransferase [Ktedonobacteraceae bacterium]|jgi:ribosomal protein S18 acetylase RimI-like enzyme|nr:GNAT family N-acetyltransferase [Ktedonobacteraceae bacterium]
MSELAYSLRDASVVAAMERNFAEEMTVWGHVLPTSVLHREQELCWFVSGKPNMNGVLLTNLKSVEPAYVDAIIAAKIAYFQQRQDSFGWSVGPSTYPGDLVSSLKKHGFTHGFETIGLAVDLQEVPFAAEPQHLASLSIREITDLDGMAIQRSIERAGFGASEEVAMDYYHGYVRVGFGPGAPWRHYLGWWQGKPVAMCSLLLCAGVAGVYGVATLPDARRLGIGTAMTYHALHVARAADYRVAILTDTEMSRAIYQRMGFREHCRIAHYQWSPERIDN